MHDYTDADLQAIIKQCQRSAQTRQSFYDVWQDAATELESRGIEAAFPTPDELMCHAVGALAGSSVAMCARLVLNRSRIGDFPISRALSERIVREVEAAECSDAP